MLNVRYEGEAEEFGGKGHIKPQGQGTITYLHGHHWAGCRYEGEFLGDGNGFPHGQGKWYRCIEGKWHLEYEGESQRGKYHGHGTFYYLVEDDDIPAGSRYEGEFSEDEYDGYGTLYNPDGSIQRKGWWAKSKPRDDPAS